MFEYQIDRFRRHPAYIADQEPNAQLTLKYRTPGTYLLIPIATSELQGKDKAQFKLLYVYQRKLDEDTSFDFLTADNLELDGNNIELKLIVKTEIKSFDLFVTSDGNIRKGRALYNNIYELLDEFSEILKVPCSPNRTQYTSFSDLAAQLDNELSNMNDVIQELGEYAISIPKLASL